MVARLGAGKGLRPPNAYDKPGDNAVIFSKCILVNPGSEI